MRRHKVEEKNASVDDDWWGESVSILLRLLKHVLPITFILLVTLIIPNRCVCLCCCKMRTGILILFLRMLYPCAFYPSEVYICSTNATCCDPREVSGNPT